MGGNRAAPPLLIQRNRKRARHPSAVTKSDTYLSRVRAVSHHVPSAGFSNHLCFCSCTLFPAAVTPHPWWVDSVITTREHLRYEERGRERERSLSRILWHRLSLFNSQRVQRASIPVPLPTRQLLQLIFCAHQRAALPSNTWPRSQTCRRVPGDCRETPLAVLSLNESNPPPRLYHQHQAANPLSFRWTVYSQFSKAFRFPNRFGEVKFQVEIPFVRFVCSIAHARCTIEAK